MAAVMALAMKTTGQSPIDGAAPTPHWLPERSALERVISMLRESTSASSAVHGTLYRQLEAYATNSDFNNYLAYILARGCVLPLPSEPAMPPKMQPLIAEPAVAASVRQVAGLLLKSNLSTHYKSLPRDRQAFIRGELQRAIGDELRTVRTVVAICITTIATKNGILSWPELVPTALKHLDSGSETAVDGALTVLCRLAEDIPHLLDQDPSKPLDLVIPKVILFCSHPLSTVRAMSLQIVNHFLVLMPAALHSCIDAYCQALFRIAEDTSIDVRKRVCTAICFMLQSKPEALAPYMRNIIEYMLVSSKHESEQVALEACEFWTPFAEMQGKNDGLREYIPRLVPLLLDNMVYSEADRAFIGSIDQQDGMVPDRAEDMRPRFHQSRLRESSTNTHQSSRLHTESAGAHSSNVVFGKVTHSNSSSQPGSSFTSNGSAILGQAQSMSAKSSMAGANAPNMFALSSSFVYPGIGGSNSGTVSSTASNNGGSSALVGQVFQSSSSVSGKDGMKAHVFDGHGVTRNVVASQTDSVGSHPGSRAESQTHDPPSDDDDDDDDWEPSEDGSGWNVRKCCALALDTLSNTFAKEVLAVILPSLDEKLVSARWEHREVAVLVLGAIADGCFSGMEAHLPSLFSLLLRLLNDPHYMIRTVTCWTLSRYAHWAVHNRNETLFKQLLSSFLDRMGDHNKSVQRAACSALANFEEEAGPALANYLGPILQTFTTAFPHYQARSRIALYDCICTLADVIGNELGKEEHLNVLLPPLIQEWNNCVDTDKEILPLLECLAFVFRAIGPAARPFAENILARCVNIIEAVYKNEASGQSDAIHVEFLTCSLDLVCGLAEAIGPDMDPHVANCKNGATPLLPLVFVAMKDGRQEVRQSAFALVGEFARARLPSMIPAFHEYVRYTADALNPEYMSVANNATWALGEFVMMAGFLPANVPIHRDAIQQALVERALDRLIRFVGMPHLNKNLRENAAMTLGRMGLVIPDALAPRLGAFGQAVFSVLRDVGDDVEKEQACHGINVLVRKNPSAVFDALVYYVDVVASWFHCKADLEAEYAAILLGFKVSLGEQWPLWFSSLPGSSQRLLKERFHL